MRLPLVAPVLTSTQLACPSRIRTTKTRSVVLATAEVGTKRVGCGRRTGHSTSGNIPGASLAEGLLTSNSTGIVRVLTSTDCATRATGALKVWLGYADTENSTLVPSGIPATDRKSTRLNSSHLGIS